MRREKRTKISVFTNSLTMLPFCFSFFKITNVHQTIKNNLFKIKIYKLGFHKNVFNTINKLIANFKFCKNLFVSWLQFKFYNLKTYIKYCFLCLIQVIFWEIFIKSKFSKFLKHVNKYFITILKHVNCIKFYPLGLPHLWHINLLTKK